MLVAALSVELAPYPQDQPSPAGGIIRAARRPKHWSVLGPPPVHPDDLTELWPTPEEDLCWLAGNWRILQRLDGHRTSLDDLLVAHMAVRMVADAPLVRCLDLGCGIGSVLLFLAWRLPSASLVGVEAQALSAGLAKRSLRWNGIASRAEIRISDFRDPSILTDGPFSLVTGTPPYFPVGTGPESDHVQRAPCRFEHRGGIEDYCATAALHLAPGAPFVACQAFIQRDRVGPAAEAAGLRLVRWCDIIPREGKTPLLNTFAMRSAATAEPLVIEPPLIVRDRLGQRTAAFRSVRTEMGMPP